MWFSVDKEGLARLLEHKGKAFVVLELIQNSWDENTTMVTVTLQRIPNSPRVELIVEDDNPNGFADLSHAFTLFAESAKKSDASKRGRFNLGEKLVLALCDEAEIISTTGGLRFDESGRHALRRKRESGSIFKGVLRMTTEEMTECANAVRGLIPPAGICTVFNGEQVLQRQHVAEFTVSLPTEIGDAEGVVRRSTRQTVVRLIEPFDGETPMLYELGIPVVETGDHWHIDVQQKVPQNFNRDNVPPSYLSRLRAAVLDHMAQALDVTDVNEQWVRNAMQSHGDDLDVATIEKVLDLRFGERRVAFDPSDAEANRRAVADGYTVVHGAQLSKAEWNAAKRTGTLLPAGQVTPSPKPFSPDGDPLKVLPREKWTPSVAWVVHYAQRLASRLLICHVDVTIANDIEWPFAGAYGRGSLTLNLGRLGYKWFDGPLTEINRLLIHEFGHHYSGNHLDSVYHDALCRLGAALAQLALDEPEFFVRTAEGAHRAVAA